MSGLGFVELGAIFLLVLILFGPEELPKLARFMARLVYQMKNVFLRLEKEWNLKYQSENTSDKDLKECLTNEASEIDEKSNHVKYSESNEYKKQ